MLYETLSQPLIILYLFLLGLACGILFDFITLILCFCKQNKIIKQILSFVAVVFSAAMLYLTNLSINFGRFRVYIVFVYLIAFAIERFTLGNLFTKWINNCYTKHKDKINGKEKEISSDNGNSGCDNSHSVCGDNDNNRKQQKSRFRRFKRQKRAD